MPRVCGVMSTRTGPTSAPAIKAPWTAAPIATARSGSISECTGRPSRSDSRRWTIGVRVAPPTRSTLSIWLAWSFASARARSRQASVRASRGPMSSSYSVRSISTRRWSGTPLASAMNSSSIAATASVESRFLASSAARSIRLRATGESRRSIPCPALELVEEGTEQQLVEIVTAEVGVAVAGEDLDHPRLDLRDRDVERAAAEVVNEQALHLGGVRIIREHGRGRLVDDPDDLQAREHAGLAGRVALALGEERRHRDHGLRDRAPERLLGPLLQRSQDDRRDLLRRVRLVAKRDGRLPAHRPLDRPDGSLRRQHVLVPRRLADEQPSLRVEPDHGRQDRVAVVVGDHLGPAAAHDGDLAVGRPQVDPDDRFHMHAPSKLRTISGPLARGEGVAEDGGHRDRPELDYPAGPLSRVSGDRPGPSSVIVPGAAVPGYPACPRAGGVAGRPRPGARGC